MIATEATATVSGEDIRAVDCRLQDVIHSLRAIYSLAGDVLAANNEGAEETLIAIREMARANSRGIDACLQKLTGARVGCFETG